MEEGRITPGCKNMLPEYSHVREPATYVELHKMGIHSLLADEKDKEASDNYLLTITKHLKGFP